MVGIICHIGLNDVSKSGGMACPPTPIPLAPTALDVVVSEGAKLCAGEE